MYKKQNIVIKLVIINTVVFLFFYLMKVGLTLFNSKDVFDVILGFFCVPSNIKTLIFRIWTPFTYMFLHQDFFHILGNMLWLFFIGRILIDYIKEKDFLTLYLLGGLAGAAMYIIAFNIFPLFSTEKIFSQALGASASVTAIVVAIATYKPQKAIHLLGLIKIPLWAIAVFLIIYDISLLVGDNAGGHFAHLGGAIFGFYYGNNLKKGKTTAESFSNLVAKLFSMDFTNKSKIKIIKNELRTKNDLKYNEKKVDIKKEVDRILDKISQSGYQSLSKKEKEFLNKFGKDA